jgi:uncharacterized protein (TIGR01777 family)
MATVLITGGTGLIGMALSRLLVDNGYKVIILSRKEHNASAEQQIEYAEWDPRHLTVDQEAFQQADYIINLAGANVGAKRWTKKRKQEIVDSRIHSGATIVKALQDIPNKVKAVISASAIGWYGPDRKDKKKFVETDPVDRDFLGETCRLWEESVESVNELGKRLVKLRTGIVLSEEGGAIPEFRKPIRFGFAAILGNGQQTVSWIHISDICRMYLIAIENDQLRGAYNAVAPSPVSNKELTISLAKKIKGRFYSPFYVPSFVLKMILGEMSIEVLKSATVSCEKIQEAGFQFTYPTIDSAIGAMRF